MPRAVDPLARRLRSVPTWHVIALGAGTILVALLAVVVVVAVADATGPYSPIAGQLHRAAVGLPVVLGLYAVGHRFVLRAPARWFLAGRPDRRAIAWTGFGLAFPAAVIGLQLLAFDARRVGQLPPVGDIGGLVIASLAAGLLAGVLEELAFRGVLLRLVEARWGARTAIAATSVAFALLHQGHAGRHPLLVLSSMLAAGLLLGVVAITTRSVWNAVAVHAGWNAVVGGRVVAAAPGGHPLGTAVLRYRLDASSSLLSGGDATLGAAPLTTLLVVVAAAAVARYGGPGRPGTFPTDSTGAGDG